MLRVTDIVAAMRGWPGLYETESGDLFLGCPVSEIPTRLREKGWRSVPRYDSRDIERLGLPVLTARYVGGARPKRFCDVVPCERILKGFTKEQAGRVYRRLFKVRKAKLSI